MNRIAMLVCNNLNFNVLHARQIFFQIYTGVAKCLLGLLLRHRNLLNQRVFVLSQADSLAAAACRRFNNDRVTDVTRDHDRLIQILY
ncbi:hypothetical protein D3C77_431110 [compost metagenome]